MKMRGQYAYIHIDWHPHKYTFARLMRNSKVVQYDQTVCSHQFNTNEILGWDFQFGYTLYSLSGFFSVFLSLFLWPFFPRSAHKFNKIFKNLSERVHTTAGVSIKIDQFLLNTVLNYSELTLTNVLRNNIPSCIYLLHFDKKKEHFFSIYITIESKSVSTEQYSVFLHSCKPI